MADYFDILFSDGHHPYTGRYTLWGYLLLTPNPARAVKRQLLLARKAVAAWCKKIPGKFRYPVPLYVFYLAGIFLVEQKRIDAAVAMLLMLDTYARPSEATDLRVESVVAPSTGRGGPGLWGIIIGNEDLGDRTKTGESDDTVILGSSDRQWIAEVVAKWYGKRSANNDDLMFPALDLAKLEALYRRAATHLKCGCVKITPHVCRHSAPSHDILNGIRNIGAVQRRGRWQHPKSVRRYEKSGRLLMQFTRVPLHLARRARSAGPALRDMILAQLK